MGVLCHRSFLATFSAALDKKQCQDVDLLSQTGAGTAASRLGMPDLGIVTLTEMAGNAAMIASLDRTVPIIADADTGFGSPLMVARTVQAYIAAGVAGLHLEDQVVSKRCGHLSNKELVDEEVFYSRIRAAVLAREEMQSTVGGDIVLIARTDALQKYGYDEAVKRLKRCIELGADVAFLEGLTTLEECKRVCEDLAPTPVLLNVVPGGVTPRMGSADAKSLGFRIVIHPILAMGAVFQSVTAAFREVKQQGETKANDANPSEPGVRELFEICGLSNCVDFDRRAGGKSYDLGI